MRPNFLTDLEINKINNLRKKGLSIQEIQKIVRRGKATISRHIQNVKISPKYLAILKVKQGGSKERSIQKWKDSLIDAKRILPTFSRKEKLLILACLYWGEGNKTEFNVINSDPYLIKAVLESLKELWLDAFDFKFSLRIYSDINKVEAQSFWSNFLNIPKSQFKSIDVLTGKKEGKLKHGMCRLRIKKGEKYFKLVMSMITLIKSEF